ncbi:DUF2283 domain-containing protein [Thiobacter aerophilum]|uniref:DUF2283 domain-containing protein n=1 Tax=Thiobacter aerophilum TaxID=3121275 RepID=A0ABV0EH51_9BURK
MNIVYFRDMDALYIELKPHEAETAWEPAPGITINYAANGEPVGIQIDQASERVNLDYLNVGNFPGQVDVLTKQQPTH